jgi:type I restriction enzyme S subunit
MSNAVETARTLKSISNFITKGATPTTYGYKWETSGIPFLRSECVSSHGLNLSQAMYISPEADSALARSRVRNGDILMTITGNVGRVVRLSDLGPANINQHIARIRINDPSFDSSFVYHYLSQPSVRESFERITTGQAYPQISLSQVRAVTVPALPMEEQERLADALTNADKLILTLEKLVSKKRAIKQGMMQELLTGRKRLPGFDGEWSRRSLSTFGSFLRGRGIKRDDVRQSGVPCIRYGEIYTTYGDYTTETASFVDETVAATALPLRTGDILFAGSGETKVEIGMNVAYLGDEPAAAGGDIIVLRGAEHDPVYLSSLLNTSAVAAQKARGGQGDAVVHINWRVLAGLEVTVPGLAEQQAIAGVLVDADAEISALERRLEATRDIKQGMMQELLTGRTRLPVDEEVAV